MWYQESIYPLRVNWIHRVLPTAFTNIKHMVVFSIWRRSLISVNHMFMMFALWLSLNLISIETWCLIKKTSRFKTHLLLGLMLIHPTLVSLCTTLNPLTNYQAFLPNQKMPPFSISLWTPFFSSYMKTFVIMSAWTSKALSWDLRGKLSTKSWSFSINDTINYYIAIPTYNSNR